MAGGGEILRAGGTFLILPFCRFNFFAKYSTYVLQLSRIVFSGSLLSCDAMFVSVGSNFLVKNALLGDRNFLYLFFHKFMCIFHNSKTIQDIWMIHCRNVDTHEQTHCSQDG